MVGTFLGVWMHVSILSSASGFDFCIVLLLYARFLLAGLYSKVTKGPITLVIINAEITMIENDASSKTCNNTN